MLSQNKKTFLITITSLVITGATLGGAVSAEQKAVSAEQEYRFPPANAIQDIQLQKPAPIAKQVTRPVINAQPPRQALRPQGYPMPYPAQRPMMNPPRYGAPGSYAPRPPMATRGMATRGMATRPPMATRGMPMRTGPGAPPPYAMQGPYNRPPPPYQGSYGNPYNRGPYNAGPYGRGPSNSGSSNYSPFGGGSPFNNFGGGPFNGSNAPWETWPFGAPDSFWSRKEFPFNDQNPTDWFQPGDPREGIAIMWDDLIAAPDDLGTMPGGWHVPSISVPNPVDLEDQLEQASKEIPDLIRVYSD